MPTYELVLLLKKVPAAQLKETLKRTALTIFETGGLIRKIENLGLLKTPYKIKQNKELNYFVMEFDSAERQIAELRDHLKRDMDLVRQRIYYMHDKLEFEGKKPECDICYDRLDVPLRPHVQKMVEISKKNQRKPFHFGGGRDYDPLGR